MRVLGIDPGSRTTGYGVVERRGSEIVPIAYGVIKAPSAAEAITRFEVIYEGVRSVLRDHAPDEVAFEALFFCKNVKSAIRLGEARAVAILAAGQSGKAYHEYSPRRVKQAVVGFGGAQKDQVRRMVERLLGVSLAAAREDASDALAVAICHLNSIRHKELTEVG